MADKATRGTKLKCQNEECALPFYDLHVAEPDCPTCGTAFDHEAAKQPPPSASAYRPRRQAPVYEIVAPEGPADDEVDDDTEDDGTEISDQLLDLDEEADDDHDVRGPAKDTGTD